MYALGRPHLRVADSTASARPREIEPKKRWPLSTISLSEKVTGRSPGAAIASELIVVEAARARIASRLVIGRMKYLRSNRPRFASEIVVAVACRWRGAG